MQPWSPSGVRRGGVLDVSDEQWSEAFDQVFLGAVRMARQVTAALSEAGLAAPQPCHRSTSIHALTRGLPRSGYCRPV